MGRTVTYQNIEVGVYTTKEEIDRFLKEFPAEDYAVDLMYFEDGYAEFEITLTGTIDVDYFDDYWAGRQYFYELDVLLESDDEATVKKWLEPYKMEIDRIFIHELNYDDYD